MKKGILILVSIFFLIQLACSSSARDTLTLTLPDRDILFQANNGDDNALGFINADGSAAVLLNTGEIAMTQPVWSQDKAQIYYHTVTRAPGMQKIGYGPIGMLATEKPGTQNCNVDRTNAWVVYPIESTGAVIYTNDVQIIELDYSRCRQERVLVDYHDNPNVGIPSFTVSDDRSTLLYEKMDESSGVLVSTLISLDLEKETSTELLFDAVENDIITDGVSYTLSPDNQMIAIVRSDGIFVMNRDGSDIRHILKETLFESYSDFPTPIADWSPDGKWLVYHKLESDSYFRGSDFSIYKLNVVTGEEVKLYDGGMYPYWP